MLGFRKQQMSQIPLLLVLIEGYERDILAILWWDRWPCLNCHKAVEGITVLELQKD
jgi:hypothetical protein